jgi:uncharacterized protein YggU (UPF0235/DUF167 family)
MSRIIKVKVNTRAHDDKIEEVELDSFNIWVTAAPENNEANLSVIELVADHFGVAPSNVRIKSGMHGKHKYIEIN